MFSTKIALCSASLIAASFLPSASLASPPTAQLGDPTCIQELRAYSDAARRLSRDAGALEAHIAEWRPRLEAALVQYAGSADQPSLHDACTTTLTGHVSSLRQWGGDLAGAIALARYAAIRAPLDSRLKFANEYVSLTARSCASFTPPPAELRADMQQVIDAALQALPQGEERYAPNHLRMSWSYADPLMRCRIALLPTVTERIAALEALRVDLAEVRARAAAANIDPMLGIDDASIGWHIARERFCTASTSEERDAALDGMQAYLQSLPDVPATDRGTRTRAAFAARLLSEVDGRLARVYLPSACTIDERLAPLLRSTIMQSTGDPWWSMMLLRREVSLPENDAGPDTPESNNPARVARALEATLAARAALELGLTDPTWRAITSQARPSDADMERMLLDVMHNQFMLHLARQKDRDAATAVGLAIIQRNPDGDHANTVRTLMRW